MPMLPAKLDAELAYVTGGMSWEANYNVVAPEDGDLLDIIGWMTMDNQSGKTFDQREDQADGGRCEQNPGPRNGSRMRFAARPSIGYAHAASAGHRKSLRGLPSLFPAAADHLQDGETKQVEFIRASGVKSQRIYVYDGVKIELEPVRRPVQLARTSGNESNSGPAPNKVAIMREFKNSNANHLGMPLPKGRVRFYKRDGEQLEFTGENTIDHTPKDETVKIYTGNAFDLVGERRRTKFKVDNSRTLADESFAIKLRNHKKEPVEIRVVEHLYRWTNWDITAEVRPVLKTNAQEIEFRVQLQPDEEKTLAYKVHYSW